MLFVFTAIESILFPWFSSWTKQEINTYEHIGNELIYYAKYQKYVDMIYFNLKVWVLSLIVLLLTPIATNSNSPLFWLCLVTQSNLFFFFF